MSIRVKTQASFLPVTPEEAASHLRMSAEEAAEGLLSFYISAATANVEEITGRCLVATTFILEVPRWPRRPDAWSPADPKEVPNFLQLELRRSPLVQVSNVKFRGASASELEDLPESAYTVDTVSTPGRIIFIDGEALPDLAIAYDSVQVEFIAGSQTPAGIDPVLKMGVLFLLTHWNENRLIVPERGGTLPIPYTLDHILRSRKVYSMTPLLP